MDATDPALPDRSPSASKATFKWPCERRKAHAPHPRKWVGNTRCESDPPGSPERKVYAGGMGSMTFEEMCPGVRAHPNTMIGKR